MENNKFMRRAIELAKRASGATHPNPIVGAVIVEGEKIVAEGWHARAGTLHAERVALANLERRPKLNATLFVTLEPCSTCGRTGACTEAILSAGIARVVIGAIDPNPAHSGRGIAILQNAGVEVISGTLADECTRLNPIFNYNIVKNSPLFAAKIAMDARGRTVPASGESPHITGTLARANVMAQRRYFPAIATGSGTVLADDCALTIRDNAGTPTGCPVRFVFDRRGRTLDRVDALQIFNDAFACTKTIFVTVPKTAPRARKILRSRIAGIWEISAENTTEFFEKFRAYCLEESISGVYFEAGETLLSALFAARQANYLYAYVADREIRGDARFPSADAALKSLCAGTVLVDTHTERFGKDTLFESCVESAKIVPAE